MDFKLNEVQLAVRDAARTFATKYVQPRIDEIERPRNSPRTCLT